MSLPQVEEPPLQMTCAECTAECCKHIGIPIDAPTTWEDFQAIKRYISHEGISCYLDVEGDWVVEFLAKCGQLNGNKCMAWGSAAYPRICKEYEMKTCVMNEEGDWWEILFKTPEDVDAHCKAQNLHGTPKPDQQPCVSVPIDAPEDLSDFDDIRWYIAHRDVLIYKQGDVWYVHLNTMCKQSCTTHNAHIPTTYDVVLRTWDDVFAYCAKHNILK